LSPEIHCNHLVCLCE